MRFLHKSLLIQLLLFLAFFFGQNFCFANCTISTTDPGCTMAGQAGTFWCDTGVDGTSTNPVIKACSGTGGWYTLQKFSQALTNASTVTNNGAVTQAADFTVSGTRTLDFAANRLRNIATPTATTDAARKDYVDALSGGLAVGASTSLDFGANRLKNIATPTTTTDAARKDYVDALSGGLAVGASTSLDFGANRLQNIATPTASTDAARKDYVDNLISNPKIFTATADGGPAGTTTETTLFGTGVGSLTLAANDLAAGRAVRITMKGTTELNNTDTTTIRVKLGGTTIASGVYTSAVADNTTLSFLIDGVITCRTAGASGTYRFDGYLHVLDAGSFSGGLVPLTGSGSIDTTTTNAIDITAQNSLAGTDDVTATIAIVELLK